MIKKFIKNIKFRLWKNKNKKALKHKGRFIY